jgi:hypothetical protein
VTISVSRRILLYGINSVRVQHVSNYDIGPHYQHPPLTGVCFGPDIVKGLFL